MLNVPLVTVTIPVDEPTCGAVNSNEPISCCFTKSAVVNVTEPSAPRKSVGGAASWSNCEAKSIGYVRGR